MDEETNINTVCASQLSHFEHIDEFLQLLQVIVQEGSTVQSATVALERLTAIVSTSI